MLPVIHHQCRFNAWLENEGRDRQAGEAACATWRSCTAKFHALADELCELRSRGQASLAMQRRAELHALRDRLFAELTALLGKGLRA